jgi:ribonuclease HI
MFNWAKNNWIKSDKKIPENLEIIKEYYNYYNKGYRIDLRKIKGHAGNRYNELADQLATGKILESDILKGE